MAILSLLSVLSAVGPTFYLDELDLKLMEQGWGAPQSRRSVDRHPLKIGGVGFDRGVGTHAVSRYELDLGGKGARFSAVVGVDDEVGKLGSIRFFVYADGKKRAESTVMRGGEAGQNLTVDLSGVKKLVLLVDDAGDDINYDHADWANAVIEMKAGAPKPVAPKVEPPMPIASHISDQTEIHGPRILGGSPGAEFLFRVPATGKKPLRYAAEGLPAGLMLDPATGVVRGRMKKAGESIATLTVSGPGGTAKREVKFVCGAHKLALTPPMGWNSWNVWGLSVDAQKVRDSADQFIAAGLADFGYQYVNIDDAWEGERDAEGVLQTNKKFGDMSTLADYIHSKGLRIGIYSSPGPQTCGGYAGSYKHEYIDAKMWADWGIDYLKYDWCSYGNISRGENLRELMKPYALMRDALDKSGRDIVFSLCQYGMGDVYKWGNMVGGDLWRTTGDITDSWASMSSIGFAHSERSPYVRPSGWNDPDMLVVGHVGWGNTHPSRLKPNEQITHVTLWSMLAAPLLIGCDLTQLDTFTRDLLMNHDVIEVDQDPLGVAATRKSRTGDLEVWSRPLWDGTTAVALFNRGSSEATVTATWKALGLKGVQPVRDLWLRKEVGKASGAYSARVPSHGAKLFRIGKPTKTGWR